MEKIKYPRTLHLPYSLGATDDDKILDTDEHFRDVEVVVTIKMDGENCTVYPDGTIHARSVDGTNHPWQSVVKDLIWQWCWKMPEGHRVCGENLQATHSIEYTFPSREYYFQCFGIYDEENCLPWKDVEKFCEDNNIQHVPIIYKGCYDRGAIMSAFNEYSVSKLPEEVEGFVVRNINGFKYDDFSSNVAKFVRPNHVKTDQHWTKSWKNNKIL